MLLFDVNILVHAHREDADKHVLCRRLVEGTVKSELPFGYSHIIGGGFLRIVTHPRVFDPPTALRTALKFLENIQHQPNMVAIAPGSRHWMLFKAFCVEVEARGNLVPDAFIAALAVESGCTFVTTDRDFSRFADLDWKTPDMLIHL